MTATVSRHMAGRAPLPQGPVITAGPPASSTKQSSRRSVSPRLQERGKKSFALGFAFSEPDQLNVARFERSHFVNLSRPHTSRVLPVHVQCYPLSFLIGTRPYPTFGHYTAPTNKHARVATALRGLGSI